MAEIRVHPEISNALQSGLPVVALETAVITAGLPRDPLPDHFSLKIPEWNQSNPVNLELAKALDRAVRQGGTIPAWVAVVDGDLMVGLDTSDLMRLASDTDAQKSSLPDLAGLLADGATAGTTVSSTLYACRMLARSKPDYPQIRVMSTGGLGGFHRSWSTNLDISADLRQLASTPMCVICSGPKSVVDVAATYESLESLGCPVISYRSDTLPQFVSRGSPVLPARRRVDDLNKVAALCSIHFNILGPESSVILTNPPPTEFAIELDQIESAINQAEQRSIEKGVAGSARTPFLLAEMNRLTQGRFLDANLALLISNAHVAAEVARELLLGAKPG